MTTAIPDRVRPVVRIVRPVLWLAALGVAVAWPQIAGSNFLIVVGTLALTFLVLSESLNLVYGYAGFLCLSITVFWAIGGYVSAHLSLYNGVAPQLSIPIGAAAAGMFALLFGWVSMRGGRDAFAILTLVLLIFSAILAKNWTWFTGGTQGLAGLPLVQIGPASWGVQLDTDEGFYYAMLCVAGASIVVLMVLLNSRWGRTLRATNVDESLAQSFGVSLLRERLRAITIAGFFCGLVGGVFVFSVTLADPSLLSTSYLAPLFAALFLGGPGNFGAVALASVLVTFLPQLTRSFQSQSNLVYGVLIVVLCLLFPEGLPAALARGWRWTRELLSARQSARGARGGPMTAAEVDGDALTVESR